MTMKKFNALMIARIYLLALILLSIAAVQAQQPRPDGMKPPLPQDEPPPDKKPNLLQQLNLAPEQVQQLRRINQETREQIRAANQRQREARRALDAAIYAENPSREEVERLTRELSQAQAEMLKLRTGVEFRIRQILTPEQLARFRELRQNALIQVMRKRNKQPPPRQFR